MKWKNLIYNQCPRCGQPLKLDGPIQRCSGCNFFIGAEKKVSITASMEAEATAAIAEQAEQAQAAEDRYWANPDIM